MGSYIWTHQKSLLIGVGAFAALLVIFGLFYWFGTLDSKTERAIARAQLLEEQLRQIQDRQAAIQVKTARTEV